MNYIRHLNAFFAVMKEDSRLTSAHVSLYMAMFQAWNHNRFQNPFTVKRENMMQLSKIGSKNTYHKCLRELHLAKYIFYHTQVSKFSHIKISMIKLDKTEYIKDAQQLDFFTSKNRELPCIENNTVSVPHLTAMCPEKNTAVVPNMGRYYNKQNIKTISSVHNTPTNIFNNNMKISNAINGFVRVPNIPDSRPSISSSFIEGEWQKPSKSTIETFFLENNYPLSEAQKFYYYNQGKGWMLTDKIPIKDWHSIAHKWMLNEKQILVKLIQKLSMKLSTKKITPHRFKSFLKSLPFWGGEHGGSFICPSPFEEEFRVR